MKMHSSTMDTCWHVVIITAIITFLSVSFERTLSFLNVALMEEFGVDRETASWPLSVMVGLGNVVGILVGLLQKRCSIRYIMLVGSILTWTGILASGFATSTQWMILTMGVIYSMGFGTMSITTKYFAMMYFDAFRGIAMGITTLGRTMAGFVIPKFLLFLRGAYGFHMSLFLLGALSINITPLTYLLKEPQWCKQINQHEFPGSIQPISSACGKEQGVHQKERQFTTPSVESSPKPSGEISSMARSPTFYVIVLSSAITYTCEVIFMSSMTDYCQDRGLSTADAVWLTSCFNLTDIIGRLCIPLLADRGLLRRSVLLTLLQVLMAAVMMCTPYATTYWSLAAVEASSAILVSSGSVMHDVLPVEYFGLESLPTVYGIIGLVKAPLQLCNPLILGFFRDRTGSYDDMFRFLAGMLFFTAVLWLAVVCSERGKLACISAHQHQVSSRPENEDKEATPAPSIQVSHMLDTIYCKPGTSAT